MGVKKPQEEHRIPITFSGTEALKADIDRIAEQDGKTRSEYIRDLAVKDIKERG